MSPPDCGDFGRDGQARLSASRLVDHAIRVAAPRDQAGLPTLVKFVPFDPAAKMSEAEVVGSRGEPLRIAKGAFATIAALSDPDATRAAAANDLELSFSYEHLYRDLGLKLCR